MSHHPSKDIAAIIREGTAIDRAIVAVRRRVIQRHRRFAIWREGQVVEVPPESVERPADPDGAR